MEDHFWPSSRKRCEFMLGLMRNSSLPVADRVTAAQVALPLVHPKLTRGHANQQAVHLPAEFRFEGSEVEIL